MAYTAFIGGGNMARALIGGALAAGVAPGDIRVGEPDAGQRERLEAALGVRCFADNAEAVHGATLVVLAVKPQVAASVARGLNGRLDQSTTVVSIMAGIRCEALRRWLGPGPQLVRAMPNTPALIGFGITALYAADDIPDDARRQTQALLDAAGSTLWLHDESLMDTVTAVSGSGPAYLFLMLEAMEQAGVDNGLDRDVARTLATETLRGAAEMARRGDAEPAELRRRVTSPGGTTEAATEVLERFGLQQAFAEAVAAARARGQSLADEFGRD
jgi:pyrroline-5-carboxylate reductase